MASSNKQLESTSKFLSLVLRHQPEQIGLTLDGEGWALVDDLVRLSVASGTALDRDTIERIVAGSDKQRFALSVDGLRIRANQGHSVKVSLNLAPISPPDILYHGTATRFMSSIKAEGLHPGSRLQVHLSADSEVAHQVGARHGKPLVLHVDAKAMSSEGHLFYRSENGVWLTETVPAKYIDIPR